MLNWRIGTLEASYFRMPGGNIPGGSVRRIVCESAVICAIAISTFAFGCRNTRITETPLYEVDSMCSMSLTVVVIALSSTVMTRSVISFGESPLYVHTTLTTGMLIYGKISL